MGIIAGSIERVSTEIRHLQRTEVYELQEFFSKKQKGSSAMPHKKNPILTENLTASLKFLNVNSRVSLCGNSRLLSVHEGINCTNLLASSIEIIGDSTVHLQQDIFFKSMLTKILRVKC